MIGQMKPESEITYQPTTKTVRKRKQVQAIYALSRRNLWELALFLLISIAAFGARDLDLFALASEPLRQLLGTPPPAYLLNVALAVYLFSAVVLLLVRLANGSRPASKWSQLGYRSVFYLFYSFSGTLAAHFVAVFAIGMLLYGLEQLHIWVYGGKLVQRELVNER